MSSGIFLGHIPFALALFLLVPTGKLSAWMRMAILAMAALLTMIPVDGLSLAEYVRSLTGDLSVTTLLWLAWSAGARIGGTRAQPERQHLHLAICFGSLALLLYPAAMGLSMFDPYRLGYAPSYLLVFVFAISIGLWLVRHYFGAALLTAATAVFMMDFRSPENFWDYLIDPLLGLYCLAVIGWYVLRWIWRNLKGPFNWNWSRGISNTAFESPGKRLITSVTNLCAEEVVEDSK